MGADLREQLRQMVAVLHDERQALADMDIEALVLAGSHKLTLCEELEEASQVLDDECWQLAETAHQLNETNRRVRNLLAANVAARLDALRGVSGTYAVGQLAKV